ncbi:MAG TPA: GAF domain-containing protein [Armatimonadetes bacterium]|nr:GAF domain-containing protein [Armatimonadota bacterium]
MASNTPNSDGKDCHMSVNQRASEDVESGRDELLRREDVSPDMDYTEDPLAIIASLSAFQSVRRFLGALPNLDELLRVTLDEGLRAIHGKRGFIAVVNYHTGELIIKWTAGPGWTEEKRAVRLKLTKGKGKGIEGYVAATGQPYLAGNVRNDPYHYSLFEDTLSRIVVPLIGRDGKVIGVLSISSEHEDAFSENDLRILTALANVAAMAMSIADYHNREQKLIELGKELASEMDINALLQNVVTVAIDVLQADDCSLFLIDDDSSQLILKASKGALRQHIGEASYKLGEGLTGWVALHGEPIRLSDVREDPRWRGRYTEIPAGEIGAFLAVPIMGHERCHGVLRAVRKRPVDASYSNPFTPDDQNLLYMLASQVGVALDRAELQERLLEAERTAAFGEMSARAAHMIGNKIFALKGVMKELLSSDIPSTNAERKQLVNAIERTIYEIEELLQEFRYFVKSARVEKRSVEIVGLIRELVERMACNIKDIEVQFETTLREAWVEADDERLRRCIGELIENASHFTPSGGHITVAIKPAEPSMAGRPKVCIIVRDTGPGVPDSHKEKIFEPFYSSRSKGLGLGLAIVRSIIQAHGGTIQERGRYGEGAEFVITLPTSSITELDDGGGIAHGADSGR